MSDSTEHRNRRGRRGSLLDHAGDAPLAAGPAADGTVPAAVVAKRPAPSLLATPVRNARLSTARFAAPDSQPPAAVPAGHSEPSARAKPQPSRPGREKFGDRIAQLIGTIAPEPRRPEAHIDPEIAEPARPSAPRPSASRPESVEQDATAPDPSWRDQAAAPAPPQNPRSRDDHYHWHASSSAGGFDAGSRPLLDASILISAVWRYRYLIGAATVAGAVLGVVMALATPHRYYAESRLFVDPREIRVTEDDIRNQQLSTEAMLAITDSQLQILSSTSVLEKVVTDLGLDHDPEFNGSLAPGGIRAGLLQIKQIFTGKGGPSEEEQEALNHLRDAVAVRRDAKTFVIIIGVDTLDPEKSALIANQIVETYLDSEGQAQSSLLERTSDSIDTRINALRTDLDLAEREVERFKAENGLVGVGGQYIDDKVILALSDQLANARAMKVGIRVKADNLARVNIDDVLSGAFPEELLSSNLTELRKQFTQTKSTAESLATQLGPRHPQYISALSSLETITREISAELRRIVASSQTELQRAVETEQELASQMAVAKSRAMDQSVEFVTLRELERKATATRGIYEAFLTRSRETSERSNLSTRNVRVISPAEAPLQPMGPSRKFIAAGGMAAGFFAAVGLALLAGAVESFGVYNSGSPQARFQTPPFGGYPGPQNPAPRTPTGGPGRRGWTDQGEDRNGFDDAADEATAEAFHAARAQAGTYRSQNNPVDAQPVSTWQRAAAWAAAAATRTRPPQDRAPVRETKAPHRAPAQGQSAQFQPANPEPVSAAPNRTQRPSAPAQHASVRTQRPSEPSQHEPVKRVPIQRQTEPDVAQARPPVPPVAAVPPGQVAAPAAAAFDSPVHQAAGHAGDRYTAEPHHTAEPLYTNANLANAALAYPGPARTNPGYAGPGHADALRAQPQFPAGYPSHAQPAPRSAHYVQVPQGFMPAHGQAAPPHHPVPAQAFVAAQDPRMMPPLWAGYPAQQQPQHQVQPAPQPQPNHQAQPAPQPPAQPPLQPLHRPGPWPDPRQQQPHPSYPAQQHDRYAVLQPGATAGYYAAPPATPPTGPSTVAHGHPVMQPQMMQHPLQSQTRPQAMPWPYPVQPDIGQPHMQAAHHSVPPAHTMPYVPQAPVQTWPQADAAAQSWQQPAPQAAVASYPAVPQPQFQPAPQPAVPQAQMPPVQPTEPARPANDATIDRIRREMDGLRTRIDGYGNTRRSA